jgi:hypothetical protein
VCDAPNTFTPRLRFPSRDEALRRALGEPEPFAEPDLLNPTVWQFPEPETP